MRAKGFTGWVDYLDHLRRLSIDAEQRSAAPAETDGAGALDAKTQALLRLAALVAVAAAAASIRKAVDEAVSAGAGTAEIVAVLDVVMPQVGRPRVVKAAPKFAGALGLDLDLVADDPS